MVETPRPTSKKGLPTAAWIAIGCGGLLVICMLAAFGLGLFAVRKAKEVAAESTGSESFEDFVADLRENPAKKTAEAMIALNPDLDLVATDDEAGTITFVDKTTGEEVTLDFEAIAEGRFSITTGEGEFRVDVTDPERGGLTVTGPDGEARFGAAADLDEVPDWVPRYRGAEDAVSVAHQTTSDGVSGMLSARTGDGAEEVIDYYSERFEAAGWAIQNRSVTNTADGTFATILAELDGRTVNVTAAESPDGCQLTIHYEG